MQSEIQLLGEIFVAAVFGGIIGMQREAANKPAGFRTHVLVAASAAFLMGLSQELVFHFERATHDSLLRADPIRVVEAIITGVSFLGAGTIFRHSHENHVEGLTTAASLLFCAALGICVALHLFLVAGGATMFALLVLAAARFEPH